jgi:RNA polymerase sigma-70 factor (ECF subfamily)
MANTPPDPLDDLTDAELAARAANRQSPADAEEAFRVLHQRYNRLLTLYFGARTSPSQDDDLAQEVWLRAWNRLGGFDGRNFRAWLFQIARNLLIDEYRRPVLKTTSLDDGRTTDPDDHRERQAKQQDHIDDLRDVFRRCLERLAPGERQVVEARLAGVSPVAIAEKARVKREKIDKLYSNALKKLRSCAERSLS